MNKKSEDNIFNRIKNLIRIEDFCNNNNIPLEPTARVYEALVGECPFCHDKESNSFTVNSLKQFFYCFACKRHGDIISLVCALNNISPNEAITLLEKYKSE